MRSLALLLLLLLLPSLAVAQDWRFAHPDATLVGVIHPHAILGSPLIAAAIEEAAHRSPSVDSMVGMMLEFLSGIEEIRFSMLDKGMYEPEVVALVSGKLDGPYGMIPKDDPTARRIDATTILLGKGLSLNQALARMESATAGSRPRILARTESLSENDIWFSGQISESAMTAIMPDINMELHQLAFGAKMNDQLQGELIVEADTPAMAQKLIDLAIEAQAQKSSENKNLLSYSVDGAAAHFVMDIPQQWIVDAGRKALHLTPTPELPVERMIIIQGLNDGAREVPLR